MYNPYEIIFARLQNIETLLIDLKHNPNPGTIPGMDDLPVDIKEASKIIGLSVPTIYGLVHRREIPVMKRRGKLLFLKQELVEWVKVGRRMTTEEIKAATLKSLGR